MVACTCGPMYFTALACNEPGISSWSSFATFMAWLRLLTKFFGGADWVSMDLTNLFDAKVITRATMVKRLNKLWWIAVHFLTRSCTPLVLKSGRFKLAMFIAYQGIADHSFTGHDSWSNQIINLNHVFKVHIVDSSSGYVICFFCRTHNVCVFFQYSRFKLQVSSLEIDSKWQTLIHES